MKSLNVINFYLTNPLYQELIREHIWARRIHNLNRKPAYLKLCLSLLYSKSCIPESYQRYSIATPNPDGLDPLLSEDQVMLLIDSSKLIGLPELSYLAAALHQENKQNKL
jgi:hypothetical protein